MKRIACLMCGLLLLTACADQAVEPSPTQKVVPTVEVTVPAVSPTPEAIVPVPTPTPNTVVTTPTPTPEIAPPEEPEELTLEAARALIEQANAAIAPFLGEAPTEGENIFSPNGQGWVRLVGCSSKDELLNDFNAVFTDDLADWFFRAYCRYPANLLREEDGAVYVRPNSREILGCYYDMDLSTLAFAEPEYGQISDLALTADGFGNGTPVRWEIGFSAERGAWQIDCYSCYEIRNGEMHESIGEYHQKEFSVFINGTPYSFATTGSPSGIGEPYRVLERDEGWGLHSRTEYYPGLKVTLYDRDDPGFRPWYIRVTTPDMPVGRGVKVGDTLQDVLALYPQFDLAGSLAPDEDENSIYCRCFPWGMGEYWGDNPLRGDRVYFIFDENFIVQEIYLHFDLAN